MGDQVEEIKSKSDIAVIIGERIELKKAGSNLKGLCPFHGEKTPSFMVSPELQIFKCFGCGKSGDVFTFLEEYEGMEFYESLKYLGDRLGIKLKTTGIQKKGVKERLYEVNALVLKFYQYVLLKHPAGKKALDYLLSERGLTMETVRTFKLGYSPDIPLAIKKYIVDRNKVKLSELELAGVIWAKGGRSGDRFRGRVIFPLFDHRGNPIGFAGRILPGESKIDAAKYINSPDTPVYHKSNVLFGLNETRQAIKKEKLAIIVEGELDLISSWQAGIKNVVAIKGSALTEEQVKLLSRFSKKIVFALDADFAGNEAAKKGIFIAQREGLEVSVATLIGFKDPDEAARANPGLYRKFIDESVGIWDFMIDSVIKKYGGETGQEKSRISRELVPLLSQIDDKIVQAHYINLLARKLQVPTEAVTGQVENLGRQETSKAQKTVLSISTKPARLNRRGMLEERYIALIFKTDPGRIIKEDVYQMIESPLLKKIVNSYLDYSDKKHFVIGDFAKNLPPELIPGFSDLMMKEIEGIKEDDPDRLAKELSVVEKELRILLIREKLEELAKKISTSESTDIAKDLSGTEKEFTLLTRELNELEAKNS